MGGETYRAGPPVLGARLLAAAKLVPAGRVAADIGCDHGKLAVWLALTGKTPKVIAVDSRPMPLQKAKALVAQTGCASVVECRLGNGLQPLQPLEATVIILAGISGDTMIEILQAGSWAANPQVRLVMVPASGHARLRHWLASSGFVLEEETAVEEKGRVYAVMAAGYTGAAVVPDDLFCQLGLLAGQHTPPAERYKQVRLAHLRRKTPGIPQGQPLNRHKQLIQEVEQCLK